MSPTRLAAGDGGGRGGGGAGRAGVTALIVVAIAIGMLLLVRSRPKVEPFDPRSSQPSGANAAVLLLEQYGARVDITGRAPAVGASERAFVIADRLDTAQRQALLEFVEAGGVAVVADPGSTLHGGPGLDGGAVAIDDAVVSAGGGQQDATSEADVPVGECTVASLEHLRGVFAPTGVLFPVAPDEGRCFSDGGHAFVVVRHYGSGLVIGFGDNHIVTNQYLRYADNAGLITALLAPTPGSHVRIMLGSAAPPAPQDVGKGDETLLDLVRPGIWMALAQLALAFVVFCIARGVRPGRAVRERLPAPIASSELALATGNLMQRAQHAERAGWLLRTEYHRRLVAHCRVGADVSVDELSRVAGRRAGVDPARIREVLLRNVVDHAGLVQLRRDLDAMAACTIDAMTPDAGTLDAGTPEPAERITEPV